MTWSNRDEDWKNANSLFQRRFRRRRRPQIVRSLLFIGSRALIFCFIIPLNKKRKKKQLHQINGTWAFWAHAGRPQKSHRIMSSSHHFQLLGITWLTHWCNLTILQFIIGRILIFLKVDIKRQKLSKVFNKMKKLTNAKNNFIYFIHLPHGINIIEIKIAKIIIFYNSSDDVVMNKLFILWN